MVTEKMTGTGTEKKQETLYETAFRQYCAANERYEELIQAYKAFAAIREAKDEARAKAGESKDPLPYLGKLMMLMAEEVEKEKTRIAMHAREDFKHLPCPEYIM